MKPVRHFLDWSAPVTDRVRDWLLPTLPPGTVDLSDTCVIVPTRQAGRRLREALALHCAESGRALLPPLVQEPLTFAGADRTDGEHVAGPLLTMTLWSRILRELDPDQFTGLFPAPPPANDLTWALQTADQIDQVRQTLIEGGYLIRDVVRRFGDTLEEPERWADLARLETTYLEHLASAGWTDRAAHLIRQAEQPPVPARITRVAVAAVPDPSLLLIRALEQWGRDRSVDILVHAPASRTADFDDWGRPRRPHWADAVIDIPEPDRNLLLGANPADQARLVLARIAQEADRIGPADLAVGVPDPDVTPYLETLLAERGLTAFDPAGQPLSRHRVYQVLERCRALLVDPSYQTVSALLRHPDILRALQDGYAVHAGGLLQQLDRFQNKHLPQTLADLRQHLPPGDEPTPLHTALEFIDQLTACATRTPAPPVSALEDAVAALMTLVYANQTIDPHVPEEALFQRVAQRINRLTAEARLPFFQSLVGSLHEALQLVLHAMANDAVYEDRKDACIDLEGWLELPWNNARLLVVTGMNEGRVPDSRMSDAFLPDRLRAQWGLRCDADRLARDAYLMTALIESRRADGGTAFIAGACSAAGDPLRPSRLLFRCPDETLPDRAARLFREPPPPQPAHPVSVSFMLDPNQGTPPSYPEKISVTAFSAYLACPFRFYLSHVRKMEELTDDKAELDALDFGSITHYALQGLETMPTEDREQALIACFLKRAEGALFSRFGRRPPFPVTMQFESIRQRLIAAAAVQARLAQEGWIPRYFEQPVETLIGSLTVRGMIDRADFHPDLNAWRIIDYKTIDSPQSPADAHIGSAREDAPDYALLPARRGRDQQWRDLQLPLYAVLFRTLEAEGPVTVGHFHLPRAVTSTGLQLWDDLSDDLIQSAWACAQGVVADIERRTFWPPAPLVKYDTFETLFPRPPAETVHPPEPS